MAEEFRAKGNAFYQDGRFEDARDCYTRAISALEGGSSLAVISEAERRQNVAQLYSNRAQTYIQERNFAPALQDAVRALACDPDNEKAKLRQLVSLENLERFETAFKLVERILGHGGSRRRHPALFEYAVTARRRLRKALQQDLAAARADSVAVGRMVHDNQQLRINFGCLIPSQVPIGQFFDIAVNIGNEFGLFRRDYVGPGESIHLKCVLRNNEDGAFSLEFREATTTATGQPDGATPIDGLIQLNDRGKALFKVAIISTDPDESVERPGMALAFSVHSDSASKWNLLPIVSLPFTLASSTAPIVHDEATGDSSGLGVHCCRPVWLPTLNREILLAESPGNLGIGGKLWDSCLVLTRYLAANKHLLAGKRVIELGSGLGLVGLFCAMLGAEVTLTDIEEVVPLLDYNIKLNFPVKDSATPIAAAHFWGTSTKQLPHSPEVLVLSDVVYDPDGYAPLVASLTALATPKTVILMAHRSRNPMEHQFFDLLARNFSFELVDWASSSPPSSTPATATGAGSVAAPGKDERVLQDVKIFRIVRIA